MRRILVGALLGVAVLAAAAVARQDNLRGGVIKAIDTDKGTVTLTVDGKDVELTVNDKTFFAPPMPDMTPRERLATLKVGMRVVFKSEKSGGKEILVGMRVGGPVLAGGGNTPKADTPGLKPLTELAKDEYRGFPGGLYPEGSNERPAAHEAAGVKLAAKVHPLDADGKPAADGKIVLVSVGMSNTTQEFRAFQDLAGRDKQKNPNVVLVDGAQGGMTAYMIVNPETVRGREYWDKVDQQLKKAGVTAAQVQAAWVKEADANPNSGFPLYAKTLQGELERIVQVMHNRFPNLKLVYLSSRTYAGFAKSPLNPEPYAFESGFSVKWLIEKQIKGDKDLNYDPSKGEVKAPWLSWGPYLWANGATKNSDGLSYEASDFGTDGTHPSPAGQRKVAEQLLKFFKEDTTAKKWFLKP
jgi:hypothetical protein